MSSRDWQASGAAALAARPALAPPRVEPAFAHRDRPTWEELFHLLTESQRQELLKLAAEQGLLYAHQIPRVDPALLHQRRHALAEILSGKTTSLAPFELPAVPFHDVALDGPQREAVAAALHTPDVCLIQGRPGSGKSRVAAEIVTQAALRGERVLLVGFCAAAVDRILEQAGTRAGVIALRCLDPGEKTGRLAECVRPYLFEERGRALQESALAGARQSSAKAQETLERSRTGAAAWESIFARIVAEAEARTAASRQNEPLDELVARDWEQANTLESSFAVRVRTVLAERDQELQRFTEERSSLAAQTATLGQKRPSLLAQREQLRPLVEAKQAGRFLVALLVEGAFRPELLEKDAELAQQLLALDDEQSALATQAQKLAQDEADAATRFAERRQSILREEAGRRAEQEREEACIRERNQTALLTELATLFPDRDWTVPSEGLHAHAGLATVRSEWATRVKHDEEQADFARRWCGCVEEAADLLPERLLACANVIAATPAGLRKDPHFGDEAAEVPLFDRLILDEADCLSEVDLHALASRASRWVLIGESAEAVPEVVPGRRSNQGRPVRSPPRVTAFHRLWQILHPAPSQLPYRWYRNGDKLCCQLGSTLPEQRPWVASEPVADRPEIELLILAAPGQNPVLVEVRFPA